MKIAIQNRDGGFAARWIDYCKQNGLDYILVDCFSSDIIAVLKKKKISHLMWHINHSSSKDLMVYPYVMNAAEYMGIKTFPNYNTRWHFDDKVAQKYLFESIDVPFVPSYAFYEEKDALNFLRSSELPLVAKLKHGAGSINVHLINNLEEGKTYIHKLFSEGIDATPKALENLDQKLRLAKQIKDPIKLFFKIAGFLVKNKRERILANAEKGYVNFQKFLPNNKFDIRIIILGNIAFGVLRHAKANDFRASGSGNLDYDVSKINIEVVKIAFQASDKIGGQCLGYDFIFDSNGKPVIVEVSFGFPVKGIDPCTGYWKRDLSFVTGSYNLQEIMIENFIKE